MVLVKYYLMQSDQALIFLWVFIDNTGWVSKRLISSKISAIQETYFYAVFLTINYIDLVL